MRTHPTPTPRLLSLLLLSALVSACSAQAEPPPAMQTFHTPYTQLVRADIPADWVLEGQPQATLEELSRSPDGQLTSAIWACTQGKFRWHFYADEIVQILDGGVTVTPDGGETQQLAPGDVAYFPAGLDSTWDVGDHVRKLAVLRVPPPLSLTQRIERKLASLFD